MTSREVAQWMREEHAAVEELIATLRDRSAIVPRVNQKRWLEEMSAHIEKFSSHLRKHFDLEEDGGYLEAVTHRQPSLHPEIERLRHEHDEIGKLLHSIERDLRHTTEADRLMIAHCCCRIENLIHQIKDHEDRENLMVVSVFNDDLGTKD